MLIPLLASVVALAAVLLALLRDEPIAPPEAAPPDWEPLPAPRDVARVRFPMSFPGYNPASVEAAFDVLGRAYAQVLEEIPADATARVRRRLETPAAADEVPAAASADTSQEPGG